MLSYRQQHPSLFPDHVFNVVEEERATSSYRSLLQHVRWCIRRYPQLRSWTHQRISRQVEGRLILPRQV
jgi:hypothetical protein